MHILYIFQYFKKPSEGGGLRGYYIAKEMVERGHKVTMVTSDVKAKSLREEIVDGIHVIYVPNFYKNDLGFKGRLKAYMGFVFKAIYQVKKIRNIDVAYVTSTPLTVGYIARYIQQFKKIPYVFEVRDLWPEFPIQMGAIKNKWIIKYLRSFERRIYDNSIGVVALSPGMEEGVRKVCSPHIQTIMVPNMSKPDIFYPREINPLIVEKYSLNPSAFKVLYFGSLGIANGIEYILQAAKLSQDKKDIQFVFLGDGKDVIKIKEYIAKTPEPNVIYIGNLPTYEVSEIANCCQASITTFLDIPVLYTNSPNKLFDSLSAGLPIIVNSNGWTRKLVEEEQCGFYVDPNNPQELIDKISELKQSPEKQDLYSKNARKISLELFNKSKLCNQVVDFVEQAISEH